MALFQRDAATALETLPLEAVFEEIYVMLKPWQGGQRLIRS